MTWHVLLYYFGLVEPTGHQPSQVSPPSSRAEKDYQTRLPDIFCWWAEVVQVRCGHRLHWEQSSFCSGCEAAQGFRKKVSLSSWVISLILISCCRTSILMYALFFYWCFLLFCPTLFLHSNFCFIPALVLSAQASKRRSFRLSGADGQVCHFFFACLFAIRCRFQKGLNSSFSSLVDWIEYGLH